MAMSTRTSQLLRELDGIVFIFLGFGILPFFLYRIPRRASRSILGCLLIASAVGMTKIVIAVWIFVPGWLVPSRPGTTRILLSVSLVCFHFCCFVC